MKRRIEIIAIEREQTVRSAPLAPSTPFENCPVCQCETQWLTTAQVAQALQVRAATVHRWLATHKVHGIRTPGGRHRVCRQSLLVQSSPCDKPTRNPGVTGRTGWKPVLPI